MLYILKLENNKYYVGKSDDPETRINQHMNGNGSEWTKKYKPVDIVELVENDDEYDEDKYTLKYMEKYGINNVRGGSFCQVILSEENKNTILKMINSANNKCYLCGEFGHLANKCNNKNEKKLLKKIIDKFECKFCCKKFDTQKGAMCHENLYCKIKNEKPKKKQAINQKETNKCFRCNRTGHFADNCFATTYDNGDIISDSYDSYDIIWNCEYCNKEFSSEYEANNHEKYCKKYSKRQIYTPITSNKKNVCFRCSREGHFASDCYANTDIYGNFI
jgi:hypothetical protein